MLTNEQITHLKKELEEAKHDILSRFKENDQFQLTDEFPYQSSGELSSYDNHPGDQATELYEREKDLALLDHEREHLRDIDYSLKQIENGTYGICEVSGKEIPYDRLEALPTWRNIPRRMPFLKTGRLKRKHRSDSLNLMMMNQYGRLTTVKTLIRTLRNTETQKRLRI